MQNNNKNVDHLQFEASVHLFPYLASKYEVSMTAGNEIKGIRR